MSRAASRITQLRETLDSLVADPKLSGYGGLAQSRYGWNVRSIRDPEASAFCFVGKLARDTMPPQADAVLDLNMWLDYWFQPIGGRNTMGLLINTNDTHLHTADRLVALAITIDELEATYVKEEA